MMTREKSLFMLPQPKNINLQKHLRKKNIQIIHTQEHQSKN